MPAPCWAARTTSTPRAAPRRSCSSRCARPTAGCCAPSTPARAKLGAYLEDHAFLLEALLVLYEATFEERWFTEARALADTIVARFADPERGGFFSTADDHETLIARRKDLEDTPIPSGGSAAAFGLLRLAALTGEHAYEEQAAGQLALLHEIAVRHPNAFGHLLQALDLYLAPRREVALAGDPAGVAALAAVVRESRSARTSCSRAAPGDGATAVALMEQRTPVDGRAAAYVCERFACRTPVTEPDELRALLEAELSSSPRTIRCGSSPEPCRLSCPEVTGRHAEPATLHPNRRESPAVRGGAHRPR